MYNVLLLFLVILCGLFCMFYCLYSVIVRMERGREEEDMYSLYSSTSLADDIP
jgi:hypothetical protein